MPRQLDWLIGVTVMPLMFLLLFRYIFGGTVQATMPAGEDAVTMSAPPEPPAAIEPSIRLMIPVVAVPWRRTLGRAGSASALRPFRLTSRALESLRGDAARLRAA